jgi:hypothetical protein
MNLLESQLDGTSDHNDLIPLLLGLWKLLDGLVVFAEAQPGTSEVTSVKASARDKEILFALVGLFSIRRTLQRWLTQYGTADPREPSTGLTYPARGEDLWR